MNVTIYLSSYKFTFFLYGSGRKQSDHSLLIILQIIPWKKIYFYRQRIITAYYMILDTPYIRHKLFFGGRTKCTNFYFDKVTLSTLGFVDQIAIFFYSFLTFLCIIEFEVFKIWRCWCCNHATSFNLCLP